LTSVRLTDLGGDRVQVDSVGVERIGQDQRQLPYPPSASSCELRATYGWPDAEAKARAAVRFLRHRAEVIGLQATEWCEEYFGVDAFGGSTAQRPPEGYEPPEVIARLAWRCETKEEASRLGREAGLLGLAGPPMIAGAGRARDGRPTQLLSLTALAVPRDQVDAQVRVTVHES
ncbi:MAG TPA: hypothetical protein DEG43_00355, partial [Acidimicrobiaceae bacterium]|nr:hypothetical protein [Acidimicrobiaceae bacterium]